MLKKQTLFQVGITDAVENEILEYIDNFLQYSHENCYIVTPNPEIIVYAQTHPEFKLILNKAEIALCDGIGLYLAAKFLNRSLKSRVTGTDLVESLCKNSVKMSKGMVRNPVTIGFLGAGKGVAVKTAECLVKKYPGLQVVFAGEEWNEEGFSFRERSKIQDPILKSQLIAQSNESLSNYSLTETHGESRSLESLQQSIDILFVAYGFPKQEEWMAQNSNKIPVRVMVGVGGAFDYISGHIWRAPAFLRMIGLEWLFRLIRQPWRIKRQIALFGFIKLVFAEKRQGSSQPT